MSIRLFGTESPAISTYRARPLGSQRLIDPLRAANPVRVERIAGLSPDGRWLSLCYAAPWDSDVRFTLIDRNNGAESEVPMSYDWNDLRCVGLTNEGRFIGRAEVGPFDNEGSRRCIVFDPAENKLTVLPPAYNSKVIRLDPGIWNHTPRFLAPDGMVIGDLFCPEPFDRSLFEDEDKSVHAIFDRLSLVLKTIRLTRQTLKRDALGREIWTDRLLSSMRGQIGRLTGLFGKVMFGPPDDSGKSAPEKASGGAIDVPPNKDDLAAYPLLRQTTGLIPHGDDAENIHSAHCLWYADAGGEWKVRYLPSFHHCWICPAAAGKLIVADENNSEDFLDIAVGLYDGKRLTPVKIHLHGTYNKVLGVASDGSFWGSLSVPNPDAAPGASRAEKSHFCSYIARPDKDAQALLLDLPDWTMSLHGLSPNASLAIGTFRRPAVGKAATKRKFEHGHFLLRERNGGYELLKLVVPGWRLDDLSFIAPGETIFGVGTCTDRKSRFWRLRMGLELQPQA